MSEISEQEAKEFAGMYEDGFVIKDLQDQCSQLQAKNDALVARVARLEGVIDKVDMYHGHCHDIKCSIESSNECGCGHVDAQVALNETPSESLAHIHAAAVEKLKEHADTKIRERLSALVDQYEKVVATKWALMAISLIRQQSKDHE